jgi:dipeptidase E
MASQTDSMGSKMPPNPPNNLPRLVMYSDQIIPQNRQIDSHLLALISKAQPKIGYIPANADPSRTFYQECAEYYAPLGVSLEPYFELDLRYEPALLPELLACDAIHLSGGNTFYFLRWLKMRGMLDMLRTYALQGGVLVGVSAGAILMTPDAEAGQICGDRLVSGLENWDGIGLVDFHIIPHLNRFPDPHTLLEGYSKRKAARVFGIPDGSGLVIRGEELQEIGEVLQYAGGQPV